MTNVTRAAGRMACSLIVLAACGFAQTPSGAPVPGPAESFYLRLRSVGLDKSRVFKIRDGALDRGPIHISFDDGTIAFTQDVEGHITGALFLGDGDILLRPPNAAERASLALFTGAAILEENISLAYLRFNDDVLAELRPSLRPPDDPEGFVNLWDPMAKDLAQEDALRLLIGFDQDVPSSANEQRVPDHFLAADLRGRRLGTFDVRYDTFVPEQVSVGQHQTVDGVNYYNLWLSYALATPKKESTAVPAPRPAFQATQFKIQAEIKPPTELSARADVTIKPLSSGRRVLLFELSRLLQVKSVEADGKPVEFIHNQAIEGSQLARRGNDALAVFLPEPLESGKKIHLTFQYSGAVLSEAANGLLYVGEHGTWYPNIGLQLAWFDLEFRYPVGWTLVATGKPGESRIDGTTQLSHWTTERPVPVAGFNLGKYSRTVTHAGNVSVETYATSTVEKSFPRAADTPVPLPGGIVPLAPNTPNQPLSMPAPAPSPSRNAEMVGATAARAVDFYQQHFGQFPFSELLLTQFPGPVSQGWPGLIFLSSYAFLSPEELARLEPDRTARLLEGQIIAHETAHQWWGDLVGWSSYRDQWIMEALANYSALMLLENRSPAEFHEILRKYRDDLLEKNSKGEPLMDAGPVTFGKRLSSSEFPAAYEAISYGRGTWLFHMLRGMLDEPARKGAKPSDEPFLRALLRLRTEYEGKTITTAELVKVFEAELPKSLWYENHKSLDWFLDEWVNGSAVPRFELHNLKFTDEATSTIASGTIVQDDAPDTLVMPVPLYVSVGGKNVFLGRVFAEGHETPFHVSAPLHARKILLDPEQTLLSRNIK